jgi:hypothetical protein
MLAVILILFYILLINEMLDKSPLDIQIKYKSMCNSVPVEMIMI